MKTSLEKDILAISKSILEQALPPIPPVGGAPQGGRGVENNKDDKDSSEKDDNEMVSTGQPPIDNSDPIRAIYDYGMAIAKETPDPQVITNAFKSAIQVNLGSNISQAWPLIERLRNTENTILMDVANRLALFISGTIQENNKKVYMKVSREEIRKIVKETLKTRNVKKTESLKEMNLTATQLEKIIQNTVKKVLKEGALFDTYRSQVGQVRSGIEQQLLSTEIQDMAINLFEKICQKVGIDSDNLTPDAEQYIKNELDQMVVSAQEIGVKLMQVATAVKTARGETPEKQESGEE